MVLDDLLLHSGDGLVVFLQAGGRRRLHRLGGLGVRLEALVLLDVGDSEMALRELQVAPGLLVVGLMLRYTCGGGGVSKSLPKHLKSNRLTIYNLLTI